MVAPHDFEFNEETSYDNEFQARPSDSPALINQRAMAEFHAMVQALRAADVTVLVPERRTAGARTPDAVFPNNWFATEHDGTVLLFPMAPPGRRLEKRIDAVEHVLDHNNFVVRNIINVGRFYETRYFLEGTGSLVIDHDRREVFAARSERCHPEQLQNFAKLRGYQACMFDTASTSGRPIYHTNVILSIGDGFAVLCPESIPNAAERRGVLERLGQHHEVIEIDLEQVQGHMCGNILQVQDAGGNRHIVMSQRASEGLSETQRVALARHGKPLVVQLDTIEQVGGGSARCMMAEIFLPRKAAPTLPPPDGATPVPPTLSP